MQERIESSRDAAPSPQRSPAEGSEASAILQLQRSAGNAAVGRLLASGRLRVARQASAAAPAAPADRRVREVLEHLREGRWDVDSLAARLTNEEMALFSAADRVRVVADIGGGHSVGGEDEDTIIRLLDATPAGQRAAVRAGLVANRSTLLQTLEGSMHGNNYERYHRSLRRLMLDAGGPDAVFGAQVFPWSDPGAGHSVAQGKVLYDKPVWTPDGRIRVSYSMGRPPFLSRVAAPAELAPDQLIGIYLLSDDPEVGGKARETIFVPAVNLLLLHDKQSWRDVKLAVNIGLAFGGVTGVAGATSTFVRIVEALSAAVGLAAVGVDEYRREIARAPGGIEFLRVWDQLQFVIAVYTLGRAARQLPHVFRRARDLYRSIRASLSGEKAAEIEREMEAIGRQIDDAEREASALPLLNRFRNAEEVAKWTVDTLSKLRHGTDATSLGFRYAEAMQELAKAATPENQRLLKLVPAVVGSLRNPQLYARVLSAAWQRAMARRIDINAALVELATERGEGLTVVSKFLDEAEFFEQYATLASRIIDTGAGAGHGVHTHLLQDLVVDLGLAEQKFSETAIQFRVLLKKAWGRDLTGVAAGDLAWRGTYDSLEWGALNRPEDICPALAPLGFK
jgi:hypothetical protein